MRIMRATSDKEIQMTTPLDSRVLAHLQRREAVHAASTEGVWQTNRHDGIFTEDGGIWTLTADNALAIATSHNSTPSDLAAIRALLDIRCWCKTITSLEHGSVCVPCAALTAWVADQDQQVAREREAGS